MALSPPSLTTIPREIRDQIWEFLFIKKEEQDPAAANRELWLPDYPLMEAAIYLVNHQLNQEHNENLRKRDKRLNMHICIEDLPSLLERGFGYRKNLSYPSLFTYRVEMSRCRWLKLILQIMMFVAYQMRKQTIHRHQRMIVSVDATKTGIYLGKIINDGMKNSYPNANITVGKVFYGSLDLEIDVMELSLTTLEGTLKDEFDFEKCVRLALSALRELPHGDNTDCDLGTLKNRFCEEVVLMNQHLKGRLLAGIQEL